MERAFTGQDIFYHGEGLRQQDFTHADDIADAVRLSFSDRAVNGVYNISGGRPVTMKELGTLAVKCFPGTASKVLPSGKPDEQEGYKALFSIEKAKQLLHWQPRVTLESGLTEWAGHLRRGR